MLRYNNSGVRRTQPAMLALLCCLALAGCKQAEKTRRKWWSPCRRQSPWSRPSRSKSKATPFSPRSPRRPFPQDQRAGQEVLCAARVPCPGRPAASHTGGQRSAGRRSRQPGHLQGSAGNLPAGDQHADARGHPDRPADLAQAKANLELNQTIVNNRTQLFNQGAIPGRDLDTAKAALVQAQAAYDTAAQHLHALQNVRQRRQRRGGERRSHLG